MDAWFAHRPVRDLRPGDHAWLEFVSRQEQEHVVGAFVYEGLSTAEKIVYVADARAQELPGMLSRYRIDPRPFAEIGQLRIISPRVLRGRDGRLDPDRLLGKIEMEIGQAFEEGYRGVRVTGDLSWAVRQPGGYHRVLGCEHRMGAAIAPSTLAMAICQVDRGSCSSRELIALRNEHEVLVEANPEFDDGVLKITRTFEPTGLRLEGELDGARHAVFAETLSTIATINCDVHLDLGGLRFIDLGALNLLTVFANRPRNGGRLLLDNIGPDLDLVFETVGWHRLPGLTQGSRADRGAAS
jgi:anti-anti-sigma regulatory factor